MTFAIRLTPDREETLRRVAARRGIGAVDAARVLLEERLDEEQGAAAYPPGNGAELVAYWRAAGVIGTWADRTDITDSAGYARELRRRAEARTEG